MSLKAGLRLGGAPTVRDSACTGLQVPMTAADPTIAATSSLHIPMSTPYLRKFVEASTMHPYNYAEQAAKITRYTIWLPTECTAGMSGLQSFKGTSLGPPR